MARKLAEWFEARPLAAINLTPFVPVLLVLLAVMAAVASRPGRPVNLYVEPGSVPAPYENAKIPPPIVISLERDGVSFNQDRVSNLDEAVARAGALTRTRGSQVVAIRADAEVPYARVVAVVRRLNEAGLSAQFLNEELH